jgi:demethylmenaquinone methyltransferase/2-methoxy-6-polyprenyl-1,4-benzoquinol methylase
MDDLDDLDGVMRTYYARRAPEYDDWYDRRGRYDDPATNDTWHAELARLEAVASDFGAGDLLDIACGTGRWTGRFAAGGVRRVVALDQASEMLEQTHARLACARLAADLVRGDAYALPFPEAGFDCCFFGFFLSHVPLEAVPGFLVEVRRVLRPGGQILVYDSQLPRDGRERVQIQDRPLKDGSRHRVLKVYYTPETLAAALSPVAAPGTVATESTGRYFVVGRCAIS